MWNSFPYKPSHSQNSKLLVDRRPRLSHRLNLNLSNRSLKLSLKLCLSLNRRRSLSLSPSPNNRLFAASGCEKNKKPGPKWSRLFFCPDPGARSFSSEINTCQSTGLQAPEADIPNQPSVEFVIPSAALPACGRHARTISTIALRPRRSTKDSTQFSNSFICSSTRLQALQQVADRFVRLIRRDGRLVL
jgi:hypothetical protein